MEKLNRQKLSQQGLSQFSLLALKKFALAGCLATLAACGGGGGGDGGGGNSDTFPLTVNVSGLGDYPVMLQNNDGIDGENMSISTNGTHQFPKEIPYDGKYLVSVKLQPEDRTCTVVNGSGSSVRGSIPPVQINCTGGAPNTITIGGTVSGLADGKEIVLQNNGVDNISIRQNGLYSFSARYAPKTAYKVSITKPPVGQACTVANDSGELDGNVSNVDITCKNDAETFSIGGQVKGLDAGEEVILTNTVNNNGVFETIPVNANTGFVFTKKVEINSTYAVNVAKSPDNKICTPSANTGIATENVTTVEVNCGPKNNSFTISGKVQGLFPGNTITLKNNGGDELSPNPDGSFTFPPVLNDNPYDVTVGVIPFLQKCLVTNGSGTVKGANVNNVAVNCSAADVTVQYSFPISNANEYYPVGLMQAKDGNLYGTATTREITNYQDNDKTGSIFKIVNGVTTTPQWFVGSGNSFVKSPAFPTGIMQANDGNVYGTTFLGGGATTATARGAIYKLTLLSNVFEQNKEIFPTDNQGPVADLIQDAAGNFYGITYGNIRISDGDQNGGSVFKRTPAGTVTSLYTFTFASSGTNGVRPNGRLVLAKDGFLYGVTEQGGKNNRGTIYKVKPDGTNFEVVQPFAAGGTFPAQPGIGVDEIFHDPYARPYSGLIEASDGNLYGVAKYGGGTEDSGYIFKLDPISKALTPFYSFAKVNGQRVNPATELVQFKDKDGKPFGNLYGVTQGDGSVNMGSIYSITLNGTLTTLHSFKGATAGGDGNFPSTRLVAGSDGSLYGGTRWGGASDSGAIFKLGTK